MAKSNALERYKIRYEQKTKRDAAKYQMFGKVIAEVIGFLTKLPDEIKLASMSELLMQMRDQKHKEDYAWQHEHRRIYTLLNENIGARNNMMNTRAISNVFSVSDIAAIIKASQPALPYIFPKKDG